MPGTVGLITQMPLPKAATDGATLRVMRGRIEELPLTRIVMNTIKLFFSCSEVCR
jgi:hypothetical protein